ncbi:hypothetical protein [Alteromonas lipotrueae]|nr:hypothetical protein [Alteromonas lipotrueae]
MLSILLAAHISNKDVDVWYSASSAPNTDETNGCTNGGSIADVISIGFAT